MFCTYCGTRLMEGAAFCSACGSPVAVGDARSALGPKCVTLDIGHVDSASGYQFGISIMLYGNGSGHYVLSIFPDEDSDESPQAFFTDPRGLTQIKHLIAEAERTAQGFQTSGQLQRFGFK
jgi:hypothetical protein